MALALALAQVLARPRFDAKDCESGRAWETGRHRSSAARAWQAWWRPERGSGGTAKVNAQRQSLRRPAI